MAKKNKDQAEDSIEAEISVDGTASDESVQSDSPVDVEEIQDADETDAAFADEEVRAESDTVAPTVLPTGIHERLEDAELAAMTGHPDVVHALNRITLLTGALKTALPEAIKHVGDDVLRADLKTLLGLL